ncbi:MAG: Trk system potassium transporter TrkA [Prevotellaceae bacterium]|jgi:trk system potassium uptake protein TrkA|nr:Trk system potassium transporter TrkA [Prevotellaceae bacterium]
MKITIAGAGEVGSHLAKMLSTEDHEITIMDIEPKKLESLSTHYDLMTFEGEAASVRNLTEIAVQRADLFVAVTPFESVNISAAMLASSLGAKKTLARIDSQEYVENPELFEQVGINSLVYPEMLAAKEIVQALSTSWQRINISFANGKLRVLGIKVRKDAPMLNQQFKTGFLDHARFRVVAVKRGSETIIPGGDDELLDGDIVFAICTEENLEFLREQAGKKKFPIRNVMIMGGSKIAVKTALFLPSQVKAKLFEADEERCRKVAEWLPGHLVINGDARNIDLLREEGILNCDAFVALTDNSESNILACLIAKQFGVVKTIAEVENTDYIPLAQNLDIGTIINKKLIAASHIYQLTLDESVLNVRYLPSSEALIIEFEAQPDSKVTRRKIRELHIPSEVNFGGYVRGGKGYICSGDTVIEAGDHVIVFCAAAVARKIEGLFS